MGYRELSMIEVREVLRRYLGGDGLRAIARGTGLDRKTVAKYIRAGTACGLQPGGPPPTEDQLTAILGRPPAAHRAVRRGPGERGLRPGARLRPGGRPAGPAHPADGARDRTGARRLRHRRPLAGPLRAAPGELRAPLARHGGAPWR